MQIIPLQNFIIKTCFIQFLWFIRLKCWFKGQIISRIHLSLPNAYKLMCFDRNINVNRDDKFYEWDYWSLHWWKKLTLEKEWCHEFYISNRPHCTCRRQLNLTLLDYCLSVLCLDKGPFTYYVNTFLDIFKPTHYIIINIPA